MYVTHSHLLRNTGSEVPLLSVSSAADICWLYAGKLWGRCGEWGGALGGAGGLGGTAEKVLARGGGAGACKNVKRREKQQWNSLQESTGESTPLCSCDLCVHACARVFVSYARGFAGDGAVYVSHGFQDVEGNKSDLVEAITTLPPALGRFNHLSAEGGIITDMMSNPEWMMGSWMHHEHILLCVFTWTAWLPYLELLPLLHWQLAAVPGYEVVGAAVESLGLWWECAAISERKRRQTLHRAVRSKL